jgi:hypothetical protein
MALEYLYSKWFAPQRLSALLDCYFSISASRL